MYYWREQNIPAQKMTGTTRTLMIGLMFALFATFVNSTIVINIVQAQTGTESEIFRVIMTIFGVDKSKGDVVTIVTMNNGELSGVKLFESDIFPSLL
jgi:hypothetical protein